MPGLENIYPEYKDKITKAYESGYTDDMIKSNIQRLEQVKFNQNKPSGLESNPVLYGVYGATKEVLKQSVPFLKYVDPQERKTFLQLSQKEQTRDLLFESLNAAIYGKLPGISKDVGYVFKTFLPKTYQFFTKPLLQKTVKMVTPKVTPQEPVTPQKTAMQELFDDLYPEAKELPTTRPIGDITTPTPKQPLDLIKTPVKPIPEIAPGRPKTLNIEPQREIVDKAIEYAAKHPDDPIVLDETKRVFKKIATFIATEEISPSSIPNILNKYGYTPKQLADDILISGSYAGQTLNQLSRWAKAMKIAFPNDPEIGKIITKPRTTWDWVMDLYRNIDNKRRAMMVGQLATAARNAESQGLRYTLNIFDDALQGAIKTVKGESPRNAFAEMFGDFTAIYGRMSPAKRKTFEILLDKYPIEKARLLSSPVLDVTLGDKVANAVNFLNKGQEYFFRKMAVDAKITALTKKAGINPLTDKIPQEIWEESIKHGLDLTFAAHPETKPGKTLLKLYKEVPFLYTIQPFPRFWLNSLKFLWDFNPTGFVSTSYQMASKNPAKAIPALSKAILGTTMLGTAISFRNSEYAGEKYYEIKSGKKTIDTRAFAPFATYLFLAEQMSHPEKITANDRIQGLIGINRIGGTGLVLLDVLRNKDPKSALKMIADFAGQYLGGFTTPLRSLKDIAGEYIPEEAIVRSTRESPITAPAVSNVPFLSTQTLPEAPSITREEPLKREKTLLRQLTGLTVKTKTELEKEIDRLGMEGLYPRTGDATLDRIITKRAGKYVEKYAGKLIQSKQYANADDDTKKFLLNTSIGNIKTAIRQQVLVPYHNNKLSRLNTRIEKMKYMEELVDKNKISQNSLATLLMSNNSFTNSEKEMLLRKTITQ